MAREKYISFLSQSSFLKIIKQKPEPGFQSWVCHIPYVSFFIWELWLWLSCIEPQFLSHIFLSRKETLANIKNNSRISRLDLCHLFMAKDTGLNGKKGHLLVLYRLCVVCGHTRICLLRPSQHTPAVLAAWVSAASFPSSLSVSSPLVTLSPPLLTLHPSITELPKAPWCAQHRPGHRWAGVRAGDTLKQVLSKVL